MHGSSPPMRFLETEKNVRTVRPGISVKYFLFILLKKNRIGRNTNFAKFPSAKRLIFGITINFISSLVRETDTIMTRAKSLANCKTLIFLKDKLTKTPILPNFQVPNGFFFNFRKTRKPLKCFLYIVVLPYIMLNFMTKSVVPSKSTKVI